MIYPEIYNHNGERVAVLKEAFDIIITDEIITYDGGEETLEFKIPTLEEKRKYIENEQKVICRGREFITRIVEDTREANGRLITRVFCEASWYDLGDPEPLNDLQFRDIGPKKVMEEILKNTDWSVGNVEITTPRYFSILEPTSPLKAIREVVQVYGGELEFDTINHKVNLLKQIGKETNILFTYKKNMKEIYRRIDTQGIVTRFYPYGADGLSIEAVNNGIPYVENYSWYDEVGKPRQLRVVTKTDDRFKNPHHLKQWAEFQLEELCFPAITYEAKVVILNEEIPDMGDIVIMYDEDLDIKRQMRTVRREINILEPYKTVVQFDKPLNTLAKARPQYTGEESASVIEVVHQAMEDVVMFNQLFNGRADDGFNYWINRGFDIDNEGGKSGKGAFFTEGQFGVQKSLEQIVRVANRDAYTISAEVEITDLEKGENGRVGFEIEVLYEDGSSENRFIEIA